MNHLHSLAVEPQSLTVETVLRPVLIISETPQIENFIGVPAESGILARQEPSTLVLAQFDDVDILRDMVNLWNTFIESGQVWALIIGLVIGYFVRGLTTYN
jgi:hypothetical protein